METVINKKVVFNPLSKITMTTSLIPVCTYWSDKETVNGEDAEAVIEWRNGMVTTYGNEILANGGELQVADNGDVIVTRQQEELYSNDISSSELMSKDWYFMNVSMAEYDLMSEYEWANYQSRIKASILRRYLTEAQKSLIYTNPQEYYEVIKKIQDNTAEVVLTVEATLYMWLERAFKSSLSILQSPLVVSVFKSIKIKQLTVSAFTDLKTQLFGVARNFYPFLYFKDTGIFDLQYLNSTPTRLTHIPLGGYDPNNKQIFWKEISSNRKNLMTICKQTNTNYYALPEGWFKTWMYGSPVNTHTIGNMDGVFESVEVDVKQKGSWIEYNVMINNESATNKLDKMYRKYMYDKYGAIQLVGTKAWKDSTSQSKFLIDYGFSVPVSKLMLQKQTSFKFEEGDKFVVYFAFYNVDDGEYHSEDDYFQPKDEVLSSLAYIGTSRVWTMKNYQSGRAMLQQPLVQEDYLKEDITMIEKEIWQKQEFEYGEEYINDGFTKGDFYYMTGTKQTSSAGFIGVTCTVSIDLPTSLCAETETFYFSKKTITLKTVLSISDINDAQQIRDTISLARYDMLAKLYTYIDMYIKRDMEITGIEIQNLDDRTKLVMFAAAMRRCLKNVDYYTEKILLEEILPKKQTAIFKVFPKTFNIINEQIDYFTHIEQVAESEYAYELKTYSGAKAQNQSYTINNRIQYVPVTLPFDIRDLKKDAIVIHFNALVPSITSDHEMGGGFIGKKEYRMMEDIYIKYIVSKSREFKSGLSNSEIVRFEVDTFNTEGLEELYQNAFPTIRKDVNILLRRITSGEEDSMWNDVYLDNSSITNMMHDHNFLSQTDSIKMNITMYNKD